MVRGWQLAFRRAALITALALIFGGCKGNQGINGASESGQERSAELSNPYPPCTDPDVCCPPESVVILGSPDDEQRVCLTLWTCDDPDKPYKCWAPLPKPSGAADWECVWTEWDYVCEGKTEAGSPDVPGGAGWECVEESNGEFTDWTCTYSYSPNPGNNPGGTSFYECDPNAEFDRLECEPKGDGAGDNPGSDTPGTDNPGDNPKPTPNDTDEPQFGPWTKTEQGGKTIWKRTGAAPMDDGICTRETINGERTLVCVGDNPNPEGQAGYDCETSAEFAKELCLTPLTKDHRPEGMGEGVCTDVIELGEITQICEETSSPTNAMPRPGAKCEPKTRRWCDGVTYCGWGIIECQDDGTWPTTRKRDRRTGQWVTVEACEEHPDGRRPDTTCANYFWFFNPECCEREDCIIPEGTNGRVYGRSAGGLCDPCNPTDPECDVRSGSLCVYLPKVIRENLDGRSFKTGETFCAQQCSANTPCPAGFDCKYVCTISIDGQGQFCTNQCVPQGDGSCYLRSES